MALNRLRLASYFVTLSETMHFGQAAEVLGISQPALSQAIRTLEVEVGCRVFNRSAGGVSLTPEGQAALMRARSLLRAEAEFIAVGQHAVPAMGLAHEVPGLAASMLLRALQPVTGRQNSSAQIVSDVRSGTLAVGVVVSPVLMPGVKPLSSFPATATLWAQSGGEPIRTAGELRSAVVSEIAVAPRAWNPAQAQEVQDRLRQAGVIARSVPVENAVEAHDVVARGGCALTLGGELPGCEPRMIDRSLLGLRFQLIAHPSIDADGGWVQAFETAFGGEQ